MPRIRQGRLFAPLGMFKGSPDRLSPEQFTAGNVPGHTVAWHATNAAALPAHDDPERNPALKQPVAPDGEDDDYNSDYDDDAFDTEGRRMASYGSAVGLHFGTVRAAIDRTSSSDAQGRAWVHPVAIPNSTMSKGKPWPDREANYSERATDLVESGTTVRYENGMEDAGSTSYRTLPETVKTWGEHVLEAHEQHSSFADRWGRDPGNQGLPRPSTAQVAAAKAGFNPVIPLQENKSAWHGAQPATPSLFAGERWNDNKGHYDKHYTSTDEVRTQERAGVPSGLSIDDPNRWVGRPSFQHMDDPDAQHRALSAVQFRQTGLRQ